MAIAPLPDPDLLDALTATRPPLRLLSFPGEDSRAADQVVVSFARPADPSPARRFRRRRALSSLAVAGLLVGLALPVRALAGTAPAAPHRLVGGTVYVVRPGDTLASIASRIGPPTQRRSLISRLATETGSTHVVAGEHLVLP